MFAWQVYNLHGVDMHAAFSVKEELFLELCPHWNRPAVYSKWGHSSKKSSSFTLKAVALE